MRSTSSEPRGSTEPRIYTPPLRELTREWSVGYDQIRFFDECLAMPLRPWQRWLLIHAGELVQDGARKRRRFHTRHVQVGRQNGKTFIPSGLALWWQTVEQVELIVGTSTKIDYAREAWMRSVKAAERAPGLVDVVPRDRRKWTRNTNGEQESWLGDSRYKIATANSDGGRSLPIDRLVCDELRQHRSYEAWDASVPATNGRPDSEVWALSNAGDDRSVVLNDERAAALAAIAAGDTETDTFWAEWSAPDNFDPLDPAHIVQAQPSVGYGVDLGQLLAQGRKAVAAGGDKLTGYVTEILCRRVRSMDPAIDPTRWDECYAAGDLSDARPRLAACLDLSPDGLHATLVLAAREVDSTRVRVEAAKAWSGADCTAQLRRDLPALLGKIRPRILGWLPAGPAAALAADLRTLRWPCDLVEIKAETPAVCMGLAEQVTSGDVVHPRDPLLDDHVKGAERKRSGEVWTFARLGTAGHVDAAYAVAGAVHLARSLPPSLGRAFIARPSTG